MTTPDLDAICRAVLDSAPGGVLVVDPDGRLLLTNDQFAQLWRLPADVVAAGDDDLALQVAMRRCEDPEGFLAEVHACYADPTYPRNHRIALKDGRVLDRTGTPLTGPDGEPFAWAWYFRDVTSYIRAEAQLQRLADTLQSSLLPPRPPEIPGLEVATRYSPATARSSVGGDFYDVFRLRSNAWGLVIGDVCGKGPEAAALTSLVRYTLRAIAQHTDGPAAVLDEVNAALLADPALGERFASVVFARLEQDRCGAWVTLSLAGHPQPVVVRRAGWLDFRGQPGSLLGLFADTSLETDRVGLGPGDALVCFTDGITEARRGDSELFVDEELPRALLECARDGCDAPRIADHLVEAAQAYAGGEFDDDVAVLVVRVPADVETEDRLANAIGDDVDSELPGYAVGEPDWGRSRRAAPPREARLSLDADPAAVPAARRFLAGVLHSWRLSELTGGDAELLTSELVTNAVNHGQSPFSVIVRYDGRHARVEVGDGSRALPHVRISSAHELGGRGVYLVDRLSARWGVQETVDGKRVWFELAVPPDPSG